VNAPAGTSWLSPKLVVGPSPIEGSGLFARETIAAGEIVVRIGGEPIDEARLRSLTPPYSSVTLGEDRHLLVDPTDPVRFGNHGCDPNLWHLDAVTIAARRSIEAGEEALIDYATHTALEDWSMVCRCGSALCRGRVSGADWRHPDLQRAYAGHWTPALQDRINGA
jgi:hypothetical protein